MSGVIKAVEWAETADELYGRYKGEADIATRKRLHVLSSSSRGRYRKLLRTLWLVRSGGVPDRRPGRRAWGNARRCDGWAGIEAAD